MVNVSAPDLNGVRTDAFDDRAVLLHARLKSGTAALHHKVEKSFDLKRRVGTLAGYTDALLTLRNIHRAVQQSFDHLEFHGIASDRGRSAARLDWLDCDLAALGVSLPPSDAPHLNLQTAAQALGCRYVIEGSALGGRHIYRFVQRQFGFDEGHGARYFFGFGEQTDASWLAFVEGLNAHPAAMAVGAEEGARRTFMLFDAEVSCAEIV